MANFFRKISFFILSIMTCYCLNIQADEPLDSDNDGMHDLWEIHYGLNPSINDADNDADNDSLSNLKEFIHNTFPNDPDTDNDGSLDGVKIVQMGDEFKVNTRITQSPIHQDIATNEKNYFILWKDHNNYLVYGQIFDLMGNKIGAEFQISPDLQNNYIRNAKISSDNSIYFIVWEGTDGNDRGIFGQLYQQNGLEISDVFMINTHTTNRQAYPCIASNGKNFFVAWHSYEQEDNESEGYIGVYGQVFDSQGNKIGAELQINSFTTNFQGYPKITSNGHNYFVAWESYYQDSNDWGIYAQLFDNDANKIGADFRVNSYTSNDQRNPNIASDGKNYFVAWSGYGQDGAIEIYGQLFDNDGNKIGTEFQINSYTLYNQIEPNIIYSGNTYFVTWSSDQSDGSDYGVSGQLFDNDANKIGAEFQINSYTLGEQLNSKVASNENVYFVFWHRQNWDEYDIYAKMINFGYGTNPFIPDTDYDGMPDDWEAENYLNSLLDDSSDDTDNDGLSNLEEFQNNTYPRVYDSDNDGMPDGWEVNNNLNPLLDDADNDADNDSLVNLNEFYHNTNPLISDTDNDGLSDGEEIFQMSEEIQINTYTTNRQMYPSIASNGKNYFVVWQSNYQDGDDDGIYAQLFDNDGDKIGTEIQINTYTTSYQSTSSITNNGENYFITWTTNGQDGDGRGVYGKLFDTNGNAITSEFQINTYTTGNQWNSAITSDGNNYFIAWISDQQNGNTYGTYGQLFDSTGNKIYEEFQINTNNIDPQRTPEIASNGHNYFVVYLGVGQTGSEIYGQIFDNEGNKIRQEFQINTYSDYIQTYPIIITNDRNHYLILWINLLSPPEIPRVSAQLFDSEGYRIGSEFHFYSYSNGHSIESYRNNYFMIWSYSDGEIYAEILDNKGDQIGEEFQVDTNTVTDQYVSCVTSDGSNFFVVWESIGQDGDNRGIFGKLITGYGTNPIIPDTDNDGLRDGIEVNSFDIDPLNSDTDADGMNDGDEVYVGMEPDNADSLFALQNITLHDDLNCTTINWFGSVASPDVEYKILWSDYPWTQWNEVEMDNGDIENTGGIRSWVDEGDNDSVPPRPQPTNSANRFYKVIVE